MKVYNDVVVVVVWIEILKRFLKFCYSRKWQISDVKSKFCFNENYLMTGSRRSSVVVDDKRAIVEI